MAAFEPDSRGARAAVEYAECPICFEPLCQQQCGAMYTRNGVRTCSHYLHFDCLQSLAHHSCPLDRQNFDRLDRIPNPVDQPEEWFRAIDVNGDGELTYQEALEGLKTAIPVDWRGIEADVDSMWTRWDPDGNGTISMAEFLTRGVGLIEYLSLHFPREEREAPPPLLLGGPDDAGWLNSCTAFFNYWDLDGNGTLEQGEMTRALVKTFRLHQGFSENVAEALENVWPIFDDNGDGVLSLEEFSAREGLGETIVATVANALEHREEDL